MELLETISELYSFIYFLSSKYPLCSFCGFLSCICFIPEFLFKFSKIHFLHFESLFLMGGGWPTHPGRPWNTLDFVCPWRYTLENPEIRIHPWKIMSWSRFSKHQFLALQCFCIFYSCSVGEEDLWGYWGVKTAYHLSCGKQPLFPTKDTNF